ncbi:hypothetical protein ABZP36_004514 [Zizania latifolia]
MAQALDMMRFESLTDKSKPDAQPELSIISQFSVGFYSAYLVADKVAVSLSRPSTTTGHLNPFLYSF